MGGSGFSLFCLLLPFRVPLSSWACFALSSFPNSPKCLLWFLEPHWPEELVQVMFSEQGCVLCLVLESSQQPMSETLAFIVYKDVNANVRLLA